MTIENFTLSEFLQKEPKLIKEYVIALQYLKPIETRKDVFNMKLKHVEFIKKNLYSNSDEALIEIVKRVQKIKKADILNMKIIEFFSIIASVKKQLKIIRDAEASSLTPSEMNFKWIAVDGDAKMSKFGIYNTLESLSGGNALQYKKYMNMVFSEIFTILYMRKTALELQSQMDKIKLNSD